MQGRLRKTWLKTMMVAFALTTMAWQASAADKKPSPTKDPQPGQGGNVAMVNGTPITQAEFDRSMGFASRQSSRMGRPVDEGQMKEEALDQLIGRELLYQESKKAGIQIDDKTVDERMAQWKKQFPTEDDYKKALKEINLTEDLLTSDMKKGLLIEKFITDKFVNTTTVSEKEIKDFYDSHPEMFKQPEQVKASHILIKVKPDATQSEQDEALKKIKEVQEKHKKGENFAELAKAYSECPSSSQGGDLGYFGRGQMAPPFEAAAFAMKPGEVSDIVKTAFGYHLIKVTDKKPESTLSFDQIKERLGQYLKQDKVQKEVKESVDRLRKEGKVEVFVKTKP